MLDLTDALRDLQALVFEENKAEQENVTLQETLDQSANMIGAMNAIATERKNRLKKMPHEHKHLKNLSELASMLKTLNDSINDRRALVKKYIRLSDQRERLQSHASGGRI